jgi:hypothetical protein
LERLSINDDSNLFLSFDRLTDQPDRVFRHFIEGKAFALSKFKA